MYSRLLQRRKRQLDLIHYTEPLLVRMTTDLGANLSAETKLKLHTSNNYQPIPSTYPRRPRSCCGCTIGCSPSRTTPVVRLA